ncbi:hypothetical protein Zmor_001974 [Zophobas morio]|uniref:Heat shock protein 70 n=1 Tax=Zophobas morio TaxID=2755281 RepID=A0AA38J6D5_9CUCU|nr:hypothetical protein Zmor_001974 [Zophobas morio]
MDDIVIGIDLGTTNSFISVYTRGRIRILENERGARVTPSFIYFPPEGGTVIGEYAKTMSLQKPENSIYEMKRLIGRQFDDTYIKKLSTYFNVTQREVTLTAAKDAGFTVLKLLNEPTAAALAYYFVNDITENHISLVYDFGGGTFDVAILEKKTDNVEVLCVNGDTQLGGHDLDNCILDYIVEVLRTDYRYNTKIDPDTKRRLRNKCEVAKKDLSSANEAFITINGMVPKHPRIIITLTRDVFEEKVSKLFKKTIDILHNCLVESKISKQSIQEVILCGGSTRIPKIQEMVSEYFGHKKLNKSVHPDECVAEGAALQAAMLSINKKQDIKQLKMVDVLPLSLGFSSLGSEMVVIIRRNTKLPTKKSRVYVNGEGDGTSMFVRI